MTIRSGWPRLFVGLKHGGAGRVLRRPPTKIYSSSTEILISISKLARTIFLKLCMWPPIGEQWKSVGGHFSQIPLWDEICAKNERKNGLFSLFSNLRVHISFPGARSGSHVDVNIVQRCWMSAWTNCDRNRIKIDWVIARILTHFVDIFRKPSLSLPFFAQIFFQDLS